MGLAVGYFYSAAGVFAGDAFGASAFVVLDGFDYSLAHVCVLNSGSQSIIITSLWNSSFLNSRANVSLIDPNGARRELWSEQ